MFDCTPEKQALVLMDCQQQLGSSGSGRLAKMSASLSQTVRIVQLSGFAYFALSSALCHWLIRSFCAAQTQRHDPGGEHCSLWLAAPY